MWLIDPVGKDLQGAPVSNETRLEWLRWLKGEAVENRKFEHPKVEGDAISRYLDSITLEQHYMERFGLGRETVRTFLSPVEGGGSGLGPDALSAYSDYAFELLYPLPEEKGGSDQMFPGGNTTIARLMLKSLIPGAIDGSDTVEGVCRGRVNFPSLDIPGAGTRVRLSSTAIHVMHDGEADKADSVTIAYLNAGKLYKLKAHSVVMAGGGLGAKTNGKDIFGNQPPAPAPLLPSSLLTVQASLAEMQGL